MYFQKGVIAHWIRMKSRKPLKNAHTANTKYGMGDYYGTGIRAKLGKVRNVLGTTNLSPKKVKTPPRSLA